MTFFFNWYKLVKSKLTREDAFSFKPFRMKLIKPAVTDPKQMPKARSGHRLISDQVGNVYAFGGYNPHLNDDPDLAHDEEWNRTKPMFNELWEFNMSNKRWTKLTTTGDAPKQLASHCAAYIDGFLLVFGGTGIPFGQNSSNQIYMCDLDKLHWHHVETFGDEDDVPLEHYGQAMCVDSTERCIYVVGGTSGFSYSLDVHKFDLITKRWHLLFRQPYFSRWPDKRYRHEIALFNGNLFVFGGGTASKCFDLENIPAFDIESKRWENFHSIADPVNGYPHARRCHGLVQMEHECFVIGGTTGDKVCDDIWHLDLKTLQWNKLAVNMLQPALFHAVSLSPYYELTIFGGVVDSNYTQRSNTLSSMWLSIPPLKEISWMAINNYIETHQLVKKEVTPSLSHLHMLGVPVNYLNRLKSKQVTEPS